MTYHPLTPHPQTPGPVVRFLRDHVDRQFHAVHCLLRLPLPASGLEAECHFAAVNVLLALISSLPTILYITGERRGKRFKDVLETYYPWGDELCAPLLPHHATRILYEMFQNPFVYQFGIVPRSVLKYGATFIDRIYLQHSALTEEQLEQLEGSPTRPACAPVTLTLLLPDWEGNNTVHVLVAGLYWGVRRMVEQLTAQPQLMMHAVHYLRSSSLSAL